jgi:hypothetical protein
MAQEQAPAGAPAAAAAGMEVYSGGRVEGQQPVREFGGLGK